LLSVYYVKINKYTINFYIVLIIVIVIN